VGSVEEVAEKILRHADSLDGISRLTFQMDTAEVPHEKLMKSIELIGTRLKPLVLQVADSATSVVTESDGGRK